LRWLVVVQLDKIVFHEIDQEMSILLFDNIFLKNGGTTKNRY